MSDLSAGLASTANAPSAAPAASPSPADTTPSTPDEALDQVFDAAEAAGAAATPPTAPTAPQATTPPPATAEAPGDPHTAKPSTDQGPIPFARHTEILKNARVKAQEELAHRVQQEYGGVIHVGQALQRDFVGTLSQLLREGLSDPTYAAQLLPEVARSLANRRGEKALSEHTEPEADLQTADGQLVYSAERLKQWQQWNAKQTEQSTDAKIAPLMQQHQEQQAKLAYDAAVSAKAQQAQPTVAQWMAQPHFKEHKDAILARQRQLAQQGHEPWSAIGIAYAEIVNTKVLPSLTQQQTQSFLTQAAAKSRGSTSDPASRAPAQPTRAKTPDEALDQIFNAALAR